MSGWSDSPRSSRSIARSMELPLAAMTSLLGYLDQGNTSFYMHLR